MRATRCACPAVGGVCHGSTFGASATVGVATSASASRSCRGWPRSYRDVSSSARVEAAVPVFSSGSVVVVALCSVSSRSARCGRCSYPECGRCLIRCWISVEQGDARIPVVGDPVDEYSQVLVEQVAWDRLLEQRAERAEHRAVDPVQPRAWVVSAVAPVLPAGRACMAGDVRVPQYRRRAFVIVLLTLWIMCRALACPCRSLLLVNSA
jgi:hypothetical protein